MSPLGSRTTAWARFWARLPARAPSLLGRAAARARSLPRGAGAGLRAAGAGARSLGAAASRAFPAPPALRRAALAVAKAGAILVTIPAASLALFLAGGWLLAPHRFDELAQAHRRSSAIAAFDARGVWLGVVPPFSFEDWRAGADHAATPVSTIPPVWRRCVERLEDRGAFEGASRRWGVDPLAMAQSAVLALTGRGRRGGSTIYMQIVRTLDGRSPSDREAPGALALRKLAEVFGARALTLNLAQRDPQEAERWIASHLPLAAGAPGSGFGEEIFGLWLAARLLFDKAPEDLRPEEQAMLAAAVKRPAILAPPGDARGAALARGRWKLMRERADFCLRTAFAADAEMMAARARLARLEPVDLLRAVPAALRDLLPRDDAAAWRILANPVRRARDLAGGVLEEARRELLRGQKQDPRGRVAALRLTVDVAEDLAFGTEFDAAFARVLAGGAGFAFGVGVAAPERATFVAALIDARGGVLRLRQSHAGAFASARVPIGSTAKIFGAVSLALTDDPSTPYCVAGRVCDPSVHTALRAFARSDTRAIREALTARAAPARLREVARVLHVPEAPGAPLTTNFAAGLAEMTPAALAHAMAAVHAGARGLAGAVASPHVVAEIAGVDGNGGAFRETLHVGTIDGDAVARLLGPRGRRFVNATLSAPWRDNGTLRALSPLGERLDGRLLAKTGTVSRRGDTLALNVVGAAELPGRGAVTFVVSIRALGVDRPLGRKIEAGSLAPLVAVILGAGRAAPSRSF